MLNIQISLASASVAYHYAMVYSGSQLNLNWLPSASLVGLIAICPAFDTIKCRWSKRNRAAFDRAIKRQ